MAKAVENVLIHENLVGGYQVGCLRVVNHLSSQRRAAPVKVSIVAAEPGSSSRWIHESIRRPHHLCNVGDLGHSQSKAQA
jgi:hypothetical protein